jgi:hypothetical protein
MAYQTDNLDILTAAEQLLPSPTDVVQIGHFRADLENLIDFKDYCNAADLFLNSYERFHKRRLGLATATTVTTGPQAKIAELLARKSTEQRTPEWYIQASKVLTASEIGTLFGSPRARGQLVLSKAIPPTPEDIERRCSKPLTCPSEFMSPFDWGIRFEPVVKQIYEQRNRVQIADLGRLVHPVDQRIAASPDGLISVTEADADPHLGALIEIKCPITRELINNKIPEEYYNQMQLQLEVTGVPKCYYVEAKFRSPASKKVPVVAGPAVVEGVLWLVEHQDPATLKETRRYVYGPVGTGQLEDPPCHLIGQNDVVIERVPWALLEWNEIEVARSQTWWSDMQAKLVNFWADVEAAREGKFELPAIRGGRKTATAAVTTEQEDARCLIQLPGLGATAAAVTVPEQEDTPCLIRFANSP